MISLKTHNILDYLGGVLLILCPFFFGFVDIDAARTVFMAAGGFLILYSLMTRYYFAVVRVIPLGVHMTLDTAVGLFVILAPWIFGYRLLISAGQEYVHYVLGVLIFCMVGLTREKTEADKRAHHISFSHA
jgi:hypothetical protein